MATSPRSSHPPSEQAGRERVRSIEHDVEPTLDLSLPARVTIAAPTPLNWSVCFDTRGVTSANIIITLAHPELGSQQVEVLLGGSVRAL